MKSRAWVLVKDGQPIGVGLSTETALCAADKELLLYADEPYGSGATFRLFEVEIFQDTN